MMKEREIIDRYYELSEQDKTEEGIRLLEEYIENEGDNVSADFLAHTGNAVLMYTDELEKGIDYFHRAIEKEPENPDIYWEYFTDLDEITDEYPETIDDAILCLTKIIEYTQNFKPEENSDVSSDGLTKKQYSYSEDIYDDFDKEASIARRYCDLAMIYMKIPDYENAEKCINKTMEVLPDYGIEIKNKIQEATMKTEIYVFSRENDLESVASAFCDCFNCEIKREDNNLHFENDTFAVDIFVFMSQMGDDYKELVRNQKNMVCGHFAQVQNCDNDIKINFIHHMQQSNTFIPVKIRFKSGDSELQMESLESVVSNTINVLKKMDGMLLVNGATVALNSENKVILSDDGMSQLEYYFPFEYIDNPVFLAECTQAQITRRNENMKELFDKHIFVMELPLNDDDNMVTICEKKEIVKRALGTMAISLYSEALLNPAEKMEIDEAREFVKNVMENYGVTELSDVMTSEEWDYFNDDNSDERTQIDFSWHYEHLYALEWALGLDEWTEPVDLCDVPKSVRVIPESVNIDDICSRINVRSKKEILDKADLIYRMDWACIDALMHGMNCPGEMNPGVVQARHKTLNWLIGWGNGDWDSVDTPT